jgi:hypothetical protein
VIVNSIYCRHGQQKDEAGWQEVARLADGQFMGIDQNATIAIQTPMDKALAELSARLNKTYIPLGSAGKAAWGNQQRQDGNALGMNSQAAAQRALTKSTMNYFCSWDLIDALNAKQITLDKVKQEDLPEALRKLSKEELAQHVAKQRIDRKALQKKIKELSAEREAFVIKEKQRLAQERSTSFESAVRKAIRAQAEARGLEFRDSLTSGKAKEKSSAKARRAKL